MSTVLRLAAFVLIALALLPVPALSDAPIIVGRGTAASCTQVTLQDALEVAGARGGGTIRFRCGRDPVTIALTATLAVPTNTAIDGGGMITLDGGSRVTIVFVNRNATVLLKNLGLSHGNSSAVELSFFTGGALFNEGNLTIHDSTLSENTGVAGGIVNTGSLAVKNSTISDNDGLFVGGIFNEGTLTITDTQFSSNRGFTTGAITNYGTLRIDDSFFSGNGAEGFGGILTTGR
jgi:hypothetical protein